MTMFGWRARVGMILPADNVITEPEFYGVGLPGVTYHCARLSEIQPEPMRAEAATAAIGLREAGVDIVVYGCALTSFDAGGGVRMQLSEVIADVCQVPVVTATGSMLAALEHLDISKVSVVTPYTAARGKVFEETLVENNIEVCASVHRDFREESDDPREWWEVNQQSPTIAYRMVRDIDRPEAQGVLVSGTNVPLMPLLAQTELDLGKPVVASNQAMLWWCLRELGLSDVVSGHGRLFEGK
jgi:maleate isomerase